MPLLARFLTSPLFSKQILQGHLVLPQKTYVNKNRDRNRKLNSPANIIPSFFPNCKYDIVAVSHQFSVLGKGRLFVHQETLFAKLPTTDN